MAVVEELGCYCSQSVELLDPCACCRWCGHREQQAELACKVETLLLPARAVLLLGSARRLSLLGCVTNSLGLACAAVAALVRLSKPTA